MAESTETILFNLKIEENRATRKIQEVKEAVNSLDRRTTKYKNTVRQQIALETKLTQIRKQRISVNKQSEISLKALNKTQKQAKDATGATTSAALELGRVVSDAPYGIRGMANNLTQLVSQMAFATKAAGGFKLALKGLFTALTGPLGIVLAITSVISALDFFYGANKKAEKSSDEVTDSLEKQRKELEKLTKGYADYLKIREKVFMNTSKDREMLKALVKETLDVTNSDERRNEALSKLVKLYPKYFKGLRVDDIKQLFEAESQVNRILQNKLKLKDALARAEKLSNEIQLEKIKIGKQGRAADLTRIGELRKEREEVRELIGIYAALDLELKEEDKGNDSKDKKSRVKSLFDFPKPKEILAFAKKQLKAVAKAMNINLKESPLTIAPNLDFELSEETKQGIKDYNKLVLKTLTIKSDTEEYAEYADKTKEVLSAVSGFIDAQFERDLVTEQNKTNALNAQLNNRLLNEKLSEDERKKIQNQIWQNDEALRKKQEAIAKKKFNTQKAFNIAMAVVDTASSALKAYGSQLVIGDPSSLIRAKIAAATTAALGLAQVATIASQKFQSTSAATPINTASGGGGGGGVGDRSFDFNLVGNTQENQLANAIQSQFSSPLKAFVVSKDITTQQELDLNIKSSATF